MPFFCLQPRDAFFLQPQRLLLFTTANTTQILTPLLITIMDNTYVNETSIEQRRRLKRESNAQRKVNQTSEQNEQCKRQKREPKARKSACKATAAPAQSLSSTNDTNFTIPLPFIFSGPLHQDDILLDHTMVPRSVSVPKACVYPFNSS